MRPKSFEAQPAQSFITFGVLASLPFGHNVMRYYAKALGEAFFSRLLGVKYAAGSKKK